MPTSPAGSFDLGDYVKTDQYPEGGTVIDIASGDPLVDRVDGSAMWQRADQITQVGRLSDDQERNALEGIGGPGSRAGGSGGSDGSAESDSGPLEVIHDESGRDPLEIRSDGTVTDYPDSYNNPNTVSFHTMVQSAVDTLRDRGFTDEEIEQASVSGSLPEQNDEINDEETMSTNNSSGGVAPGGMGIPGAPEEYNQAVTDFFGSDAVTQFYAERSGTADGSSDNGDASVTTDADVIETAASGGLSPEQVRNIVQNMTVGGTDENAGLQVAAVAVGAVAAVITIAGFLWD